MKVTKIDRVTALVDVTTDYQVTEAIWDELTGFHGLNPDEAISIIVKNNDVISVKSSTDIVDQIVLHSSEVFEH